MKEESLATYNVAGHFFITAEVGVGGVVHPLARRLDPMEVLPDLIGLVQSLRVVGNGGWVVQADTLVPLSEFSIRNSTRLNKRVAVRLTPPVLRQVVSWVVVKVEQKG